MRTAVGILGSMVMGVAVAIAQPPLPPTAKPRAVTLLPPIPVDKQDEAIIARGVADDASLNTNTTPVNQWQNTPGLRNDGIDPNVRQAGGVGYSSPQGTGTPPSATPPPVPTTDDSSPLHRSLDRLKKGALGTNSQANANVATAESPYRGTTANGGVVYAGPPAWRWYGWGSPTPGANPSAPMGQYGAVSANWYSITGATPGAFPVPVMSQGRQTPGTEPPTYGGMPSSRYPTAVYNPPALPQYVSQPAPTMLPMPNAVAAPNVPPAVTPAPLATPTSPPPLANTPPPLPAPNPPASPPPATVPPVIVPPVAPAIPQGTTAEPIAPVPAPPKLSIPVAPVVPNENPVALPSPQSSNQPGKSDSPAILPPPMDPHAMLPLPTMPAAPSPGESASGNQVPNALEALPAIPSMVAPLALPVMVTESQPKWQATPESQSQGGWMSPVKAQPAQPTFPQVPQSVNPAAPESKPVLPSGQDKKESGTADPSRPLIIARGQMGGNTPDPVMLLIERMCTGRAIGLDVRWTGSRRLTVCFEVRTVPEAQQLVNDISARPELVTYRIDFCVLVK